MTDSTEARIAVLETRVENINENITELKGEVKEMHDCLDRTRDTLLEKLKEMNDLSCQQHEVLSKRVAAFENLKLKWTYIMVGAAGAIGWIIGNSERVQLIETLLR